MNPIQTVEAADMKKTLPLLTPGDTVRVHVKVKETSVKEEIKGKPKETVRERVQVFEGVVIAKRNRGLNSAVRGWSGSFPCRHRPSTRSRWSSTLMCVAPSSTSCVSGRARLDG